MARYEVVFRPSADRALRRLPGDAQRRIVLAVADLADEPRPPGVVKLVGGENLWRIRVGVYRVVYEIHDDRLVVLVLRVAHRKDVYRNG
jgi:mRNA interferase RelE/StbE